MWTMYRPYRYLYDYHWLSIMIYPVTSKAWHAGAPGSCFESRKPKTLEVPEATTSHGFTWHKWQSVAWETAKLATCHDRSLVLPLIALMLRQWMLHREAKLMFQTLRSQLYWRHCGCTKISKHGSCAMTLQDPKATTMLVLGCRQ